MNIHEHIVNNLKVAEVHSDGLLIRNAADGLELLVDLYYQQFDRIIVHEATINPDFFDLKTKMAGDMLQKFSNYRMGLTIVGYFAKYNSDSLDDFIRESNKGNLINFAPDVETALHRFSQR
ncbi:DUF4180 domain-containing protein [Flavobacterium selenitireducens]|uniref:DUF4180 domain-containing protein n=1 Tax=Flavobacterium selenitireducens TaxID=2722704 RepID=UPI00168A85A1|nr:DUF4180 domain-containing protein [Flavobacterium selenitireducens]MBD3583109.1 DUF4180 domain-containing protein [Flavobacterium selenitireducens]